MTARDRFLALPPAKRAKWLDPAEQEFHTHGFAAASLNRILASAGESKGRSYHYFEDKGALFRAVLERCLEKVSDLPLDALQTAPDSDAFWSALASLNAQMTELLQTDVVLGSLLRTLHREPPARNACRDLLSDFQAILAQFIEIGQAKGAVRTDLPQSLLVETAFALLGAIDGWFATARDLSPSMERDLSGHAFSLVTSTFSAS